MLEILNLYNNLLKTFPDIAHLRALKSLCLDNNALDGPLPDIKFPATLTYLTLNNNPRLYGALPKSLVAQCTEGLTYSGCRQWSDCTPEQQKQGLYLRTPFFVGVTVASQDIEAFILFRIKSLGITLDMMLDAPAKGDPKSAMVKKKGKDWIPWQEQWLNGLLALKSGSKIFAILTEEHFQAEVRQRIPVRLAGKVRRPELRPGMGAGHGRARHLDPGLGGAAVCARERAARPESLQVRERLHAKRRVQRRRHLVAPGSSRSAKEV